MSKLDTGRGGLHQILEPIMLPETTNIKFFQRENTYEEPLLYISKDKTYFEILGHKIETGKNMKSMEDIANWLKYIKDVEMENEQLKKQMTEFGEYLLTKYEESKLNAQYYNGMRFASIQEQVYEDLVNRMELN